MVARPITHKHDVGKCGSCGPTQGDLSHSSPCVPSNIVPPTPAPGAAPQLGDPCMHFSLKESTPRPQLFEWTARTLLWPSQISIRMLRAAKTRNALPSVDLLSPAVKTQEMPLTHALVVSHRRSSTMPPMQNRDGCGMLRRASVWQSRSAACDACGPPLPAVALAVWAALT